MAVGFAVAGGQSHRMGEDKAFLKWGASTLLDHTLARLREACGEVRILSGQKPRYADRGRPIDTDLVDAGPLGGVLTGLERLAERGPSEAGLFLAVDLPHVPVELLRWLLELAPGWDAVVPVGERGPEPLCAVYQASCREAIRGRIGRGDLKMTAFWPDVRVREVTSDELLSFGDPAALFRNLNSPED